MHIAIFDLPAEVLLNQPTDFAKNFPGQGAAILTETAAEGELIVRWDKQAIHFIGPAGGVSWDWALVRRLDVEHNRKVMGRWILAELRLWLHNDAHSVLYCEAVHVKLLDDLVKKLRGLPLPMPIE